jgi:hypothetical protein
VVPTATPEKVKLLVESETLVLVPDRVTVCGLPLALSVIVRVPLAGLLGGSKAVGVKITLIEHVAPAAIPVPHVLVWAKTPLLDVMLVKDKAAFPVLDTVTDWGALATPTPLVKVRVVAERLTAGAVVGVVVLDPPQPVKSANPIRTAKKRLKFAAERALEFIAPPPASGWRERGRAQRRARGRSGRGRNWKA